ncbi:MAG: hypothetical protein AABN95_16150 [Acidobacteriota bacterium]
MGKRLAPNGKATRKPRTPLHLATRPEQWIEIDETIADHVEIVCGRYSDPELVRSFLILQDLTTSRAYEIGDRETVANEVEKQAFRYTKECDKAQRDYMAGLAELKGRKTA